MTARRFTAADNVIYQAWAEGMRLAQAGDGFVLGGAPVQRGLGADMSIDVAVASWRIGGTGYSTGALTNVAITPAHATLLRQDLVYADATGLHVLTGTAAAAPGSGANYPDPADLPANSIPLALVEVGAGVTSILDARIIDCRSSVTDHDNMANVSANDHHNQAHTLSGADHTGTLGASQFDDTAHGARGNGTLHGNATTSTAGFESSTDKVNLTAQTATSGTVTVDFSAGTTMFLTSNANLSITLSNGQTNQAHLLVIKYGGAHTVTFVTTIKWAGGTTPTFTSVNAKYDVVSLFWDGTNWLGDVSLNH